MTKSKYANSLWIMLIAGCGQTPGEEFREAKVAAAYDLLDPQSAQFRELRQRGEYVCGQVNGKNRMGAYSGFHNFLAYENNKRWVAERFEDPNNQTRFVEACERRSDKELEEAVSAGGEDAEIAKIELDERSQSQIALPTECNISWESVTGSTREIYFNFDQSKDRGYAYWDDKIKSYNYGRYFFTNPTQTTFTTSNGDQKFICDPEKRMATMVLEDGTAVNMVPRGE